LANDNIDLETVTSFGDEWSRFDQSQLNSVEAEKIFHEYFSLFPWAALPSNSEGFDMGCGSGRWAKFVAPRVFKLNCVDPSAALEVARLSLGHMGNIVFHRGSVASSGLPEGTQDFGYSLGVLHHVPDTAAAIRSCVALLKPGAPLLLYLYYSFDNRPIWYRWVWLGSDVARRLISRIPPNTKQIVTDAIAALIYWPLARLSSLLEKLGADPSLIPLSYYRKHSFFTMRTDARDRFGTPRERRFSRREIDSMMREAGLSQIQFSDSAPYWCAVGRKCHDA